jgi:hypothetical protein
MRSIYISVSCLLTRAILLSLGLNLSIIVVLFGMQNAYAGTVVVRKSTETFDAFALRDELAKQHQWQEGLRHEQQLTILRALPLGCLVIEAPSEYYTCAGLAYRQYQYQDEALYIQIPSPASH